MTEKLYYKDSHMRDFPARIMSCAPSGGGYEIILDRTAFFPEGGGQAADVGMIGSAGVKDVFERGEDVVHLADAPLETGAEADCHIDWEKRFRRMQNHSGEHIVSGTVHRLFGYDNVGFHMGKSAVTLDFNGELCEDDVRRVEYLANMAVYENMPVKTAVYSQDKLREIEYRSKLFFKDDVRLVSIDGVDCCACCAPHVARTGEIGIIKILDAERHRGGMRLTMVCGLDALEDYNLRCDNISAISALLSAKPLETAAAVRRVLGDVEASNKRTVDARNELLAYKIEALRPTGGNACVFENGMDGISLRELVNAGMKLTGGVFAAFSGGDGDYNYIIGSERADLRALAKEINTGIEGRGGGAKTMIQGTCKAERKKIEDYFKKRSFI
ncbi:MAG: alanyl-tRNA editing protein [Clostridia bacterium]|nr:alanyl-tRNA editing protein [Clostridia bacterium]